jgi:Fe2+ transport system protein FeoA
MISLQTCPVGTTCTILSIDGEATCVRRCMELGLVPGTVCTVERRAPFGGPVELSTERTRLGVRLGSELQIMIAGVE